MDERPTAGPGRIPFTELLRPEDHFWSSMNRRPSIDLLWMEDISQAFYRQKTSNKNSMDRSPATGLL